MRGEHIAQAIGVSVAQGSSPHARGAHECVELGVNRAGIIPACAGSTREEGHQKTDAEDHPRMRGEHNGLRRWA